MGAFVLVLYLYKGRVFEDEGEAYEEESGQAEEELEDGEG